MGYTTHKERALKIKMAETNKKPYLWAASGYKRHLFPNSCGAEMSACGSAYGGDGGVSTQSKAKKCGTCEKLERMAAEL